MQIHELNKRSAKINESQVNEVDLVGPNSIFNVGKEVVKNSSALLSNPAMATAKQQAYAASAKGSAAALASQGYKAGGASQESSLEQQIQAVKSDTALQQQVKNLSSQWASQSAILKKSRQVTMNEASVAQFDPRELTDPKYANVLKALQAQGVDPTKQVELEKQLSSWKLEFDTWAKSKLGNIGINVDALRRDPKVQQLLDSALTKVATAAQSGNANLEKEAAEEYFSAAIASNIAKTKQQKTSMAGLGSAAAGASNQSDQEIVAQSGVPLTSAQIEALGKAMRQSAGGETVIRNTGNKLLNAIARMAGFKVAST